MKPTSEADKAAQQSGYFATVEIAQCAAGLATMQYLIWVNRSANL
jgi:hypothetical protein